MVARLAEIRWATAKPMPASDSKPAQATGLPQARTIAEVETAQTIAEAETEQMIEVPAEIVLVPVIVVAIGRALQLVTEAPTEAVAEAASVSEIEAFLPARTQVPGAGPSVVLPAAAAAPGKAAHEELPV